MATARSKNKKSSAPAYLNKPIQILALHGFTGSSADFHQFAPFCRTDASWHCPNLPGHGPKPSLDCGAQATRSCVQSHWSQLSTNSKRCLIGYSLGARAALLFASQHAQEIDALILISGNAGIQDNAVRTQRKLSDQELAQRIKQTGVPAFLKFWQSTPIISSQGTIAPDLQTHMQAARLQNTAEGLSQSLLQFGQGSFPNLWPDLQQISCPTLLITGANDSKYCKIATEIQQAIPNSAHSVIPTSGHMPHLEQPSATASVVDNFLLQIG